MDFIHKEGKIPKTKNKYYNFQIGINSLDDARCYFNFSFKWDFKMDHAGPKLNFEIFGLYLITEIYDNRHWCRHCNDWECRECKNDIHKKNEEWTSED